MNTIASQRRQLTLQEMSIYKTHIHKVLYRGTDKSLARPERKQATVTDFDFHVFYL